MKTLNLVMFFVPVTVSLAALWISVRSWRVTKKAADDSAWHLQCDAYRQWELGADRDAFLEIHGLNHEVLGKHGLTPATFREYQLWLNTLWEVSRYRRGIGNVRKENDYRRKVELARTITWKAETRSGQILRSEKFRKAWPLLRRFWSTGHGATTAPLVEAALEVVEGAESGVRPLDA